MVENRESAPLENTSGASPEKSERPNLNYLSLMHLRRDKSVDPQSIAKEYEGACIRPDPPERPEPKTVAPMFPGVERKFQHFDLLRSDRQFNPNKPTVAVLDDWKQSSMSPNGSKKPGLSHGEVSAAAAEAAGFNVLRLQTPPDDELSVADSLKNIARAVKSGQLPLKKGDAVNVSLGVEFPFVEASCALKMEITPENYAAQRDAIKVKMRERVNSGDMHEMDKINIQQGLRVMNAVDRLQKLGIDIVNSAGNDGADRVNLGMMTAKHQLSATNPQGRVYPWSVSHSLTEPYPGSFVLQYQPIDLLAPKPIYKQAGAYILEDTPVKFPAERFGGASSSQKVIRDENGDPVPQYITADMVAPENLAPSNTRFSLDRGSARNHVNWMRTFEWDKSQPLPVVPLARTVPQPFENVQIQSKDKRTVDVVTGTSFSNVTYWQDRRKQWDAEHPAKHRK
jgi:hypothetical protein